MSEHSTENDAPQVRATLAEHFVMWHELEGDGPPGEWRCACGQKFGFSDRALEHQVDALAPAIADAERRALRDAADDMDMFEPFPGEESDWLRARADETNRTQIPAGVHDSCRAEVRAAVEEWFTDVDLDDLFVTKGWSK